MIKTWTAWSATEVKKLQRPSDEQHPAVATLPGQLAGRRTILDAHTDLPGRSYRRRREAACEAMVRTDAAEYACRAAAGSIAFEPIETDEWVRHVRKIRLTQGVRAARREWLTAKSPAAAALRKLVESSKKSGRKAACRGGRPGR